MTTLNLFRVKEVGSDFIVVSDDATDVKIFFRRPVPLLVGLEAPVAPRSEPRTINLFLDHFVDLFGWLRSIPFPFLVSQMEVRPTG